MMICCPLCLRWPKACDVCVCVCVCGLRVSSSWASAAASLSSACRNNQTTSHAVHFLFPLHRNVKLKYPPCKHQHKLVLQSRNKHTNKQMCELFIGTILCLFTAFLHFSCWFSDSPAEKPDFCFFCRAKSAKVSAVFWQWDNNFKN